MPQFETTYFISQIFWLILSFGGLYLGIYVIVFPMFDRIFFARQRKIDEMLRCAEKLTQEIQKLEEKIETKKRISEKKAIDRIHMIHQQQVQEYQKAIKENESSLLKLLQKKIQHMEHAEERVLMASNEFVLRALKGDQ